MKKLLFFLILTVFTAPTAYAVSTNNATLVGGGATDVNVPAGATDFVPVDILLYTEPSDTECATAAFANALAANANKISESADQATVQQWITSVFSDGDLLQTVLACPEFAGLDDDDTIKLQPIKYTFPGGREIVINYETQPKILKQRITLANKRDLPSDPNPRISPDDGSVWTNTDPAWYGILVVESGTLDGFVGPDKNNTISLQWLENNIDTIFPQGSQCTGKSALTGKNKMINRATEETVNLEDDTNDYYVAGDVNLQWISYLEIALDVAITIATAGTGTVALGATKSARASRALKNLSTTLKALSRTDDVRDYIRLVQKHSKALQELAELEKLTDAASVARRADKIKEIENYEKTISNLERTNDNVRRYREYSKTFSELNQYRHALRSLRTVKQRGNLVARTWRAVRAASSGTKLIRRAEKVARSSTLSNRIRDWLFVSTMRNAGAMARLERTGGIIYGILTFIGGMYDWTETSTGDFTSGIEFKPLGLLSADDLQGQENVVNHGMWLMWAGDAYSAADDDAAFLQAMDFANKFHFNLDTIQTEQNNHACNVDIYVVRPIIRNPDTDNPELYYLVMNDEPWTTRDIGDE